VIDLGAKKKWKKKNLVQILKVGHLLVAFIGPMRSYSHFEQLGMHSGQYDIFTTFSWVKGQKWLVKCSNDWQWVLQAVNAGKKEK
jgi:hypothetical protein